MRTRLRSLRLEQVGMRLIINVYSEHVGVGLNAYTAADVAQLESWAADLAALSSR